MPNAFGFVQPGVEPMGGPQQVGARLLQQGMAPGPVAAAPPPSDRELREAGARHMALAPGSENSAYHAAVGEALTRLGGGAANNPNPFKNRDSQYRQFRQLGLSDTEARLLNAGGGA